MNWWPLRTGSRLYSFGYALFILSGALPFWFDAAQLWHKEIIGLRMFSRSIVLVIAFLGGNPHEIAFSVYNVLILATTPVLIMSPYFLAEKRSYWKSICAIAVVQLGDAWWGLWQVHSKYQLRYGFFVWILALIIMAAGMVPHLRKSANG